MVKTILTWLLVPTAMFGCGQASAAPDCAVTYVVAENALSISNSTLAATPGLCVLAGDELYGGFWNTNLLPADGGITFIKSADEILFVDNFLPGGTYSFGYDSSYDGSGGITQFDADFTQFSGGPSLLTADAYNDWDLFFGVVDVSTDSRLSIDNSALNYDPTQYLAIHETLVVNDSVVKAITNTILDNTNGTPIVVGREPNAIAAPEPGTLAIYATGLAGLGLVRRFRAGRQWAAFNTRATSTEK